MGILSKKKLISIIVPMHNEAGNVSLVYNSLDKKTEFMNYNFEFIFVDDGSSDETTDLLRKLRREDDRVGVLEFSRNFGKEAAVSAGLHIAKGDAVVIMDADLQHPPRLLHEFIEKWEAGAEVVVGVKKYSNKESLFKRSSSAMFYKIFRAISDTDITPHATDYRLLDRSVVEAFGELTERNRMTRGIIDWLGFKQEFVHFVCPPRKNGKASYSKSKLFSLALNSVTSYSLLPLRIAGYLGLIILVVSAPLGVFVIVEKYVMNDPYGLHITGSAILALLLMFLIGIVLVCLGLISLYIEQIHIEVTNRPLYVLRKRNTYLVSNEEDIENKNKVKFRKAKALRESRAT